MDIGATTYNYAEAPDALDLVLLAKYNHAIGGGCMCLMWQ